MQVACYREADGFDLGPVQRQLDPYGITLDPRPKLPLNRDSEDWIDWMAWHAAFAKVRTLDKRPTQREPADLEVQKEADALKGDRSPPGPIYDGHRMLEAYHGPLPPQQATPGSDPVVVLTDRLIGTFEGDRYHVRFLVAGHPSIVSVPGFIDGPARDRSFYLAKQALGSAHDANAMVNDDHLARGDDRIPACVASAILQSIKYAQTGDPFCEAKDCRLFNPHWQAELLDTMATNRLCSRHEDWLARVASAP